MAVHIEPSARRGWEDEGERIAPDLADSSAVLVVGSDPRAAARVAIAIARRQARRRRVALVDAVGELAPIEKLLPEGVSHGLVDMLDHGVSLGRVAIPVDRAGNLFVIPSGAALPHAGELFTSDGWSRLTSSFRDAGALLLVITQDGSGDVARIATLFDGAVLAGDARSPAGLPVLAHAHNQEARSAEKPVSRARVRAPSAPRAPFWVAIAATVLAVAALAWWAIQSSFTTVPATSSVTSAGAVVDSQPSRSEAGGSDAGDSSASAGSAGSAAPATATSDSAPPATAASPDSAAAYAIDSSAAVPFGVALAQYNDVTAALTRIAQESARGIPASTYAPFYDTNLRKQVYIVIAGAFHDRDDAATLLRSLRRQRVLASAQGHVIDAPFAILVRSGLSAGEARSQLDAYRVKGMPAYSLVQSDGTVNIYAGAFRTTDEAKTLLESIDANGTTARVVRRAGRPGQ
ncbi:MAG TPA: SPOR domain-containing protein [Gemmatimonadaceae bacterium]|nr:SPOR domain-containing protein [Gemmatimonadaceae bacterium]